MVTGWFTLEELLQCVSQEPSLHTWYSCSWWVICILLRSINVSRSQLWGLQTDWEAVHGWAVGALPRCVRSALWRVAPSSWGLWCPVEQAGSLAVRDTGHGRTTACHWSKPPKFSSLLIVTNLSPFWLVLHLNAVALVYCMHFIFSYSCFLKYNRDMMIPVELVLSLSTDFLNAYCVHSCAQHRVLGVMDLTNRTHGAVAQLAESFASRARRSWV